MHAQLQHGKMKTAGLYHRDYRTHITGAKASK